MLRAITILLSTSTLLYAGDQNAAAIEAPQTQVRKRFVIVDRNGQRQVYQIPAGGVTSESAQAANEALSHAFCDAVRPVIGVRCHPIGQLLRTHLKLKQGAVVISGVSSGLPAEKAGLVVGDILLSVNSNTVVDPRALAAAVQASANEAMTVEYLHAGNRRTVAITAELVAPSQVLKQEDAVWTSGLSSPMFMNGFGPAMQLDDAVDLDQQISELMQEMRAAKPEISPAKETKEFTRELDKLRARMAELEERLSDGKKPPVDSKQ